MQPRADKAYLLRRISKLHLDGKTSVEIAAKLTKESEASGGDPVPRSTVSKYIGELRKQWAEDTKSNLEQARAKSIARLERQIYRATRAYKKSTQDAVTVVTTYGEEEEDGTREIKAIKETKVGQCGDPRYLKIIEDAEDKICKLLGLYAPVQTENVHKFEITEDEVYLQEQQLGLEPPRWTLPHLQQTEQATSSSGKHEFRPGSHEQN